MTWGHRWVVEEPPVPLMHHDHVLDADLVCRTCGQAVLPGDVRRQGLGGRAPAIS
jgi:hypothetical protein